MSASVAGQYNTFTKSHESTHGLTTDYSRNPKKFQLSEWAQYVNVDKNTGYYLEMTVEMAGRVLNSDLGDLDWPDGAPRPKGWGNTDQFEFKSYITKRRTSTYSVGELAADQASFPLLDRNARIHAQRMITAVTQTAITAATTSGNYATGHALAVSSVPGVTGSGYHDQSTTARMDIKRTLDYGAELIMNDTLGAVEPDEIMVVMGPEYARRVSVSQEIVDYVKQSPVAREFIEKRLGPAAAFGLPEYLHGYKTVVERARKTTSRKGGTTAKSAILSDDYLIMCSRPGGLEGVEGAPSFSTFTIFWKEEMTVESRHDKNDRRYEGSITCDWHAVVTAPISGVLFTSPTS